MSAHDLLAEAELFFSEGCLAVSGIVTWRENAVWRDAISFIWTVVALYCVVGNQIRVLARAHLRKDLHRRLLWQIFINSY